MERSAACIHHPERAAARTCDRCGDFACEDCLKTIAERRICEACRALDGVDFVEAYRAKAWGKRDHLVWLFGLGGALFYSFTAVFVSRDLALRGGDVAAKVMVVVTAALQLFICVAYFLRYKWARVFLGLSPLINLIAVCLLDELSGGRADSPVLAGLALLMGVPIWLGLRNGRNKLAFEIPVDEKKLERLYETNANNLPARIGLALSVLSLLIPHVIPLALIFGVVGLFKVDPEAWPPVDGRKVALASLAIAGFSGLCWGTLVAVLLL